MSYIGEVITYIHKKMYLCMVKQTKTKTLIFLLLIYHLMNIYGTLINPNKTDCIPLGEPDVKQILLKRGMTSADSSFKKSILAAVGGPTAMNVQRRANLNNLDKLMVTWTFK